MSIVVWNGLGQNPFLTIGALPVGTILMYVGIATAVVVIVLVLLYYRKPVGRGAVKAGRTTAKYAGKAARGTAKAAGIGAHAALAGA
jgi:putative exporter of polyketide antibiotics